MRVCGNDLGFMMDDHAPGAVRLDTSKKCERGAVNDNVYICVILGAIYVVSFVLRFVGIFSEELRYSLERYRSGRRLGS